MRHCIYVILIIILISCTDNPQQPVITPAYCPLPLLFTDDNAMPIGMHYTSKLFPDGAKLFYSVGGVGANILDLRSIATTEFNIRPLLPINSKLALAGLAPIIHWCPYDNTKFATIARLGIDTVGDGKKYPGGYHLITVHIRRILLRKFSVNFLLQRV